MALSPERRPRMKPAFWHDRPYLTMACLGQRESVPREHVVCAAVATTRICDRHASADAGDRVDRRVAIGAIGVAWRGIRDSARFTDIHRARLEPGQARRAVLQIARINRVGHERRKSMVNAPAVSGHRLCGFRQQRPFAMPEVSAAASGLLLSAMGPRAEAHGPVRTRVATGLRRNVSDRPVLSYPSVKGRIERLHATQMSP